MTRAASSCPLGPEFDPFLFAPIGAEPNGMPLSVLSALARIGVDPWQEAARLTALSEANATQAMAALLAGRPDGVSGATSDGTTAARLIALLPRRADSNKPARRGALRTEAAGASLIAGSVVLVLILFALMLGMQAVTARHRPPARMPQARAPTSLTGLPGQQPRPARPIPSNG